MPASPLRLPHRRRCRPDRRISRPDKVRRRLFLRRRWNTASGAHDGGEDLYDGDDYYCAFATFEEASAYCARRPGPQPLVLVRQDECINEPEPGRYEHHTGERLTEWRVEQAHALVHPDLRRHGSPALNS